MKAYDVRKSAFVYENEVFEYEYFNYEKEDEQRKSDFFPIMIRVWCSNKKIDTGWVYSDNSESDGIITEEAFRLVKPM